MDGRQDTAERTTDGGRRQTRGYRRRCWVGIGLRLAVVLPLPFVNFLLPIDPVASMPRQLAAEGPRRNPEQSSPQASAFARRFPPSHDPTRRWRTKQDGVAR